MKDKNTSTEGNVSFRCMFCGRDLADRPIAKNGKQYCESCITFVPDNQTKNRNPSGSQSNQKTAACQWCGKSISGKIYNRYGMQYCERCPPEKSLQSICIICRKPIKNGAYSSGNELCCFSCSGPPKRCKSCGKAIWGSQAQRYKFCKKCGEIESI